VTDLLFNFVLSAALVVGIITRLKWARPAFELAGHGGMP